MLHVKINPDLVTSVIWGWSLTDAGWTSYGQKVFTAWKWLLLALQSRTASFFFFLTDHRYRVRSSRKIKETIGLTNTLLSTPHLSPCYCPLVSRFPCARVAGNIICIPPCISYELASILIYRPICLMYSQLLDSWRWALGEEQKSFRWVNMFIWMQFRFLQFFAFFSSWFFPSPSMWCPPNCACVCFCVSCVNPLIKEMYVESGLRTSESWGKLSFLTTFTKRSDGAIPRILDESWRQGTNPALFLSLLEFSVGNFPERWGLFGVQISKWFMVDVSLLILFSHSSDNLLSVQFNFFTSGTLVLIIAGFSNSRFSSSSIRHGKGFRRFTIGYECERCRKNLFFGQATLLTCSTYDLDMLGKQGESAVAFTTYSCRRNVNTFFASVSCLERCSSFRTLSLSISQKKISISVG